jgi:hypothetical protein
MDRLLDRGSNDGATLRMDFRNYRKKAQASTTNHTASPPIEEKIKVE